MSFAVLWGTPVNHEGKHDGAASYREDIARMKIAEDGMGGEDGIARFVRGGVCADAASKGSVEPRDVPHRVADGDGTADATALSNLVW